MSKFPTPPVRRAAPSRFLLVALLLWASRGAWSLMVRVLRGVRVFLVVRGHARATRHVRYDGPAGKRLY